MPKHLTSARVSTPEDAVVFLADCTLSTCEDLAFRARPPKGELRRQIGIAQHAIDWIKRWDLTPYGRAIDVIEAGGSVEDWLAGQTTGKTDT